MESDHILAVRRGGDDGVARLIISRSPDWGDEDSLAGVPLNKLTVVCVPELAPAILRTFEFDAVELASDLDAEDRATVTASCGTALSGTALSGAKRAVRSARPRGRQRVAAHG